MSDDEPRTARAQQDHLPPLPWEQPTAIDRAELEILASVSRRLDRARRWLDDLDVVPSAVRPAADEPTC